MNRSSPLPLLISLLACGLCACAEQTPDIVETTPWAALSTAFGGGLFDPGVREAMFSEAARRDLTLPDAITAGRYQFLSVAELRRVDDTRRVGEVAFAVDGWPASLEVELARGADGGWRIERVAPPAVQQRLLELLGPTGLPIARDVQPWSGGLAGRDAAGRPTAAVLLKVQGDHAFVDGGEPLPLEEGPVGAALGDAIKTRRELADDAHATYRPHVALALPRAASSKLHVELSRWALDAGAEALQIVVRSREGTPAFVPLARRTLAPGGTVANAWRIVRGKGALVVEAGDRKTSVPDADGALDLVGLEAALRASADAVGAPDGLVLVAHDDVAHGMVIDLHLAARAALPEVPMTGEVAE